MSRRGKPKTTPDRKSLLGKDFSDAGDMISYMRLKTVRTMTSYAPSAVDTLKMLWPEQVLEDCRRGRAATSEYIQGCGPYPFAGATLRINFANYVTDYLPPKQELMGKPRVHDEVSFGPEARPLFDFIDEVMAITHKFAAVAHVLQWMDEHATANAVCYYWPSILKLAPGCAAIQEARPDNFREPKDLHKVLPLLRDTATTVASTAFLKTEAEATTEKGLSLVFSRSKFTHRAELAETDVVSPEWTYSF